MDTQLFFMPRFEERIPKWIFHNLVPPWKNHAEENRKEEKSIKPGAVGYPEKYTKSLIDLSIQTVQVIFSEYCLKNKTEENREIDKETDKEIQ